MMCLIMAVIMISAVPSTALLGGAGSIQAEAAKKSKSLEKEAKISVGEILKLKINNTKNKVTWKSSKPAVAKVNAKGQVVGRKAGKATITGKVDGYTFIWKVTVKGVDNSKKLISVEKKSLKFSGKTTLKVTYHGTGTIYYNIRNSAIVSAKWKKWNGKTINLELTGKEKGTTMLTLYCNQCKNKVLIPVEVTGK